METVTESCEMQIFMQYFYASRRFLLSSSILCEKQQEPEALSAMMKQLSVSYFMQAVVSVQERQHSGREASGGPDSACDWMKGHDVPEKEKRGKQYDAQDFGYDRDAPMEALVQSQKELWEAAKKQGEHRTEPWYNIPSKPRSQANLLE